MKIKRISNSVYIDLSVAEARVFLEELSNVRGGARLPKLRQVCAGIETSLALAAWAEIRRRDQKHPSAISSKIDGAQDV